MTWIKGGMTREWDRGRGTKVAQGTTRWLATQVDRSSLGEELREMRGEKSEKSERSDESFWINQTSEKHQVLEVPKVVSS